MRLWSLVPLFAIALTSAAHAQPRVEMGAGGSLSVAGRSHRESAPWGVTVGARAVWPKDRWAIEVGADLRISGADELWYQGDSTWVRDPWVFRTRMMVAGRVDLFSGRLGALFGRVGAGVEHRVGRYDRFSDDYGDEGRVSDHSGAFALEPSVGGRMGAADRIHGVLVLALPMAFHRKGAIRAHGSLDNERAVDVQLTIHIAIPL